MEPTTSVAAPHEAHPQPVAHDIGRSRAGQAHAVHPSAAGLAGTRRLLNLVVAIVLLVVTAPAWLLIALLIKLTSRGPVLYNQTRVGLDLRRSGIRPNDPRRRSDIGGRPFTIYKFRTMYEGAENGTGAVWAAEDDPRITPVGRVLRQYRLDELPQLINVIRGDMNLVGPRPERPSIVSELRKEIPHYQQRHRTLPGITGHAQVNLQYDASLDDVRKKVDHDLEYLQKASAWEDFKIMIKTIPVMLFRRGSR
jgi:lipopolysaccharide/colanic/teichoic acid biosynthesis glycosyltransferase